MAEEKSAKKDIRPYVPPKECPKCGSRMANHADRYTCGKCSYTEFKSQAKEAQTEQKAQDAKKPQKPKQGKKDSGAAV
jgi:Ribosomal protein S27AE